MANPTVAELMLRIRGICRELTATYWADTDAQMLGWATMGLEQQHMLLRKALDRTHPDGSITLHIPDPNHPYWRQFWKSSSVSVVADTTDYTLPATEANRFDIFHSLVDSNGKRLSPYDIGDELMYKRGRTLGVGRGNGVYTFLPSGQIRILVSPGSFGTPKESQTMTLYYFRGITHHESTSDTIDIRDEFTAAPVQFGVFEALKAKRIAAPSVYEQAIMLVKAIPQG